MNKMVKTGIIPFTYFGGINRKAGSTFLRVDGLVENSLDFEVWKHGHKYDRLIFQKVYWQEMMEYFKGPKILDICDPDWISGTYDLIDIGNKVDAITCSSQELTTLIKSYFPQKLVVFVPDRLNFKNFPPARTQHYGKAKNVTWFGFIHNAYATLEQLYNVIVEHDLDLTIISNQPYDNDDLIKQLDPRFIYYDQNTIYHHLKNADIILNPRSEKALFKYKSDNKTIIGLKLGVPIAKTESDILHFLDADNRNEHVLKHRADLDGYNIITSAEQYNQIFEQIEAGAAGKCIN